MDTAPDPINTAWQYLTAEPDSIDPESALNMARSMQATGTAPSAENLATIKALMTASASPILAHIYMSSGELPHVTTLLNRGVRPDTIVETLSTETLTSVLAAMDHGLTSDDINTLDLSLRPLSYHHLNQLFSTGASRTDIIAIANSDLTRNDLDALLVAGLDYPDITWLIDHGLALSHYIAGLVSHQRAGTLRGLQPAARRLAAYIVTRSGITLSDIAPAAAAWNNQPWLDIATTLILDITDRRPSPWDAAQAIITARASNDDPHVPRTRRTPAHWTPPPTIAALAPRDLATHPLTADEQDLIDRISNGTRINHDDLSTLISSGADVEAAATLATHRPREAERGDGSVIWLPAGAPWGTRLMHWQAAALNRHGTQAVDVVDQLAAAAGAGSPANPGAADTLAWMVAAIGVTPATVHTWTATDIPIAAAAILTDWGVPADDITKLATTDHGLAAWAAAGLLALGVPWPHSPELITAAGTRGADTWQEPQAPHPDTLAILAKAGTDLGRISHQLIVIAGNDTYPQQVADLAVEIVARSGDPAQLDSDMARTQRSGGRGRITNEAAILLAATIAGTPGAADLVAGIEPGTAEEQLTALADRITDDRHHTQGPHASGDRDRSAPHASTARKIGRPVAPTAHTTNPGIAP